PPPQVDSDKSFVDKWNKQFENEFLSKSDIYQALSDKHIGNVELIEGNIMDTLEDYIEHNPQLRIALLHIDTDVYEPAKFGLNKLFDRVVRGGIVIFDDYATIEGETLAVDEFFANNPNYQLKKFTFSHTKPSYVIKM
ncbi:MAG: class I SAM-dependent methyltransferase, partial [Selenomonadaceae bacterium]|nr:class I SAM-dependent methyltransferase [Selenomonadaceae bacterium]